MKFVVREPFFLRGAMKRIGDVLSAEERKIVLESQALLRFVTRTVEEVESKFVDHPKGKSE